MDVVDWVKAIELRCCCCFCGIFYFSCHIKQRIRSQFKEWRKAWLTSVATSSAIFSRSLWPYYMRILSGWLVIALLVPFIMLQKCLFHQIFQLFISKANESEKTAAVNQYRHLFSKVWLNKHWFVCDKRNWLH